MEYGTNQDQQTVGYPWPPTNAVRTSRYPHINEQSGNPEWLTHDTQEIKRLLKLAQVARPGKHDDAFLGGTHFSASQVYAFFDTLPPVELDFMVGRWRAAAVPTNNLQDGNLAVLDFYGKRFHGAGNNYEVDPLFCWSGDNLVMLASPPYFTMKTNPYMVPSTSTPFRREVFHKINQLTVLKCCTTKKPQAHTMIAEHRGVYTTAMVYDELPMLDVFRKVDENTILLVFILKGFSDSADDTSSPFLSLTRDPDGPIPRA